MMFGPLYDVTPGECVWGDDCPLCHSEKFKWQKARKVPRERYSQRGRETKVRTAGLVAMREGQDLT
jgi:hypothetical protein